MHEFPPFPGFRTQGLQFLSELTENNDRDWFNSRKEIYTDELQWPMRCLVMEAAERLSAEGIPVTADPKKSLFRIYRDTRFSKNKAPYKTTLGAVLSKDGTNKSSGIVYIHVEPGGCFLASGFYRPESSLLRKWRLTLVEDPGKFENIKDQVSSPDVELIGIDYLKRMPRGFEAHADHSLADYLKWKSFIAQKHIRDEEIQKREFVNTLVNFSRQSAPLLEFGWSLDPHST